MNKKYLIPGAIAIILIAAIAIFLVSPGETTSNGVNINTNALTEQSSVAINHESKDISNALISTDKSDTNTVFLNNSATMKLTNSVINKTGDTQTSGDDADFYGVNSAVLVKDSSRLTIENCEIVTNSTGSNGIFVTNTDSGQGGQPGGAPQGDSPGDAPPDAPKELQKTSESSNDTVAEIKDVTITTYQDKSRGLDSTFSGIIKAEKITINTNGNSCAALATDRGEGNVTVKDSVLNTGVDNKSGHGSPIIYSTGNITVENSKGTAYISQIACIEGKNSITLIGCDFTCFAGGNRKENDQYVDLGGVFIYQSMSGDADVGTSVFKCIDTTLSIDESSEFYTSAPMFHVTNTKADIYLENSEFNFGSGILFDISSQNQWGNAGSNGGDVNLTCQNEKLNGDIIVDSISSLNMTLKSATFEGVINSTGTTHVVIDKDSTWTLTGDCNITSLENSGTINLNGFKLFVNGVEYTG